MKSKQTVKINILIIFCIFLIACADAQKKQEPFLLYTPAPRYECYTVGDCIAAIKNIIERNWKREPSYTPGLKATVQLELDDSYNITTMKLVSSSGSNEFDQSTLRAIYKSSPFVELKALNKDDYEKFKFVKFVFDPVN